MLDVHNIIADLQIAEVGKEGRDFRFRALRTRGDRLGFIEQVARTEDCEMGLGQQNAIGDVGRGQRCGEYFAGEVAGLVGVAFAAAGAASKTK